MTVTILSGSAGAKEMPEELQDLYARSAVLMDGSSGRILLEKNGDEILPMASTTKIMTCILALEMGDLSDEVRVSANAASQPEVRLGVRTGERYRLQDLLYSMMLESHNDSAVVIAEHIGGSVEQFAALMNAKVRDIGCENTHYVTPNGLDAADEGGVHSTTAENLARVLTYCISESPQREAFLQITGTRDYTFQDLSGNRSFSCVNHNAFLDMMEGALTGKTGFTTAAGYCYVGALKQGDRVFVTALLACGWPGNRSYKWKDTRRLMEYGLAHYQTETISYQPEKDRITVKEGLGENQNPWEDPEVSLELETAPEEKKEYLVGEGEKIICQATVKKAVEAPVKKGTMVGIQRYYLDGILLEEVPLVTAQSVQRRQFVHSLRWVINRFIF